MKKTTFLKDLQGTVKKAREFIHAIPDGKTVHLLPEEDEGNDELIDQLPMVSRVDKHGFYEEYSVRRVTRKGDEIELNLWGRGETTWSEKDVAYSELGNYFQMSNDDICFLADQIAIQL
jgi:hypothetical protein